MANTLATPTWVLREVAYEFTNSIKFLFNVDRTYDDQYRQAGAKVGNTVKARRPQRFTVTDGQALQPQDLYDELVDISLTNQKNVGFGYSSTQATTELDDIRERYVKRGAEVLANACDKLAFEDVYRDVWNAVGTPGAGPPTTNLTYLQGGDKITDQAGRTQDRRACLDTAQMSYLVNANLTLFNPASKISEQYRTGMFGRDALGFAEWYVDQARPTFTTGASTTATPIVNGASQTGASLITSGWGSGNTTLRKGDVFTVAGVFSTNPDSYVSSGRLQQFTVTADSTDSGGAITIPISPSIITSGALQTVSTSPANSAVITYWAMSAGGSQTATASPTGMLFLPEAFAFVMADLARPNGGANSEMYRSRKYNMAMRYVEQYNIQTDQNPSRLDVLIGAAAIEPRFAVRVQS